MIADEGVLITFLLYLLFMIAIGWFFFKRTANLSDYILGGRGLNTWVASLSAQASDMSGWLLLGLPGLAYASGLGSVWIALGLGVGAYLNWKVVAKRLRKYTEIAGDSLTLPDYFEKRFKSRAQLLRIVSAVFILVFFLIYTASGFVAGATLFNTVFGISYLWALIAGVLVIIVYIFLGGFMAVSWTDFVQGALMFFAILIIPILAVSAYGGVERAMQELTEREALNLFADEAGGRLSTIGIISLLAWGLGYFGQPHILARFMAIRRSRQIRTARRIAIVWVVVSLAGAIAVGTLGNILLDTPLPGQERETVFMLMVNELVSPVFTGIILSAILAAIMSTADSQLLVASSALTEDLYRTLLRKQAGQRELVRIGRIAVIFIAGVAFIIALNPESTVLGLVAYAWGGFGAAFGPMILFSLFWKRMTYRSAVAGVMVGGLTALLWKQLEGGLFELYEILPGFILSSAAILIVSLLDARPGEHIEKEFESVETIDL